MRLAFTLLLAFMCAPQLAYALQPAVSTTRNPVLRAPMEEPDRRALSVAYFGETATHVGLSVGVEYHLSTTMITKRQPRPLLHKQRIRQNFLITQISGYNHPKSHLALMATGGVGTRRITRRDVKFEGLTSVGYMHLFRHGTTYKVNDAGELEAMRLAQSPKLAVQVALGFGQDFNWRAIAPKPLAWHIRPGLLFEIPHNTLFLPRFTLETGVTYRFGGATS